jgi:hypothetical protein
MKKIIFSAIAVLAFSFANNMNVQAQSAMSTTEKTKMVGGAAMYRLRTSLTMRLTPKIIQLWLLL